MKFDLTQLNLQAGIHNISVKAKAEGYKDSPESDKVEYVVGGVTTDDTVIITAGTYTSTHIYPATPWSNGISGSLRFSVGNTAYSSMRIVVYGVLSAYFYYDNTKVANFIDALTITSDWVKDIYKTITIENDQVVSKEFYEWFDRCFDKLYINPSGPSAPGIGGGSN